MNKIREFNNFIIFEDLSKHKILYEKIFNTFHHANNESIKQIIQNLESFNKEVNFKKLDLEQILENQFDSLVFNVTEECNLRCGYCTFSGLYKDERFHSKNKLHIDSAIPAIDFFMQKSKNKPYIMFYGGEPLLNQQIISKIVKYIKQNFSEKKPLFGLTTNFIPLKNCLEFLIDNDFMLSISLDGNKKIHDLWRKDISGKGTFNKIYQNIERLANDNYEYYTKRVGFSVTITDPSKLFEIYEFFSLSLFKNNAIQIQSIEKRFLKKDIFKYEKKINDGKRQFIQLAKIYTGNIINSKDNNGFLRGLFDRIVYPIYTRANLELPSELFTKGMCKPGFRKLFVDTNGDYYMCEKIGRRLKLGNIVDGFDYKNPIAYYNKYSDIKKELCNPCWAIRLCDSCAASSKSIDDISIGGQRETCNQIKEKIIQGLSIYSYLLRNDKNKRYKDYYSKILMR